MFESIGRSLKMYTSMGKVMFKQPVTLIPLAVNILLMFILYSIFIIGGILFFLSIQDTNVSVDKTVADVIVILLMLLFTFFYSMVIVFMNTWLLEILQQIDRKEKVSIVSSFKEFLTKDLIKVFPIAVSWAVVVVALRVIKDKLKEGSRKIPFIGGFLAWVVDIIEKVLQKGIRLYVFLTLPAVAWDDKGPIDAFKRAAEVFKRRWDDFFVGFASTAALNWLILYPASILAAIGVILVVFLSPMFNSMTLFWVGVIMFILSSIYGVVGSQVGFYIEQMYMGQLYLWHKKWEKAVEEAKAQGKPEPDFNSIPAPSFLDDVKDI